MDNFLSKGFGAEDGFWGSVIGGIGEGLGKVAEEVLPVWAASQMGMEPKQSPVETVGNPIGSTSMGDLGQILTARTQQPAGMVGFMDPETVNVSAPSANSILAIGVVIVGLLIAFKMS